MSWAEASRSLDRMRSTLPVSILTRTSRTGSPKGFLRLLACRCGSRSMRSERMLPSLGTSRSAVTVSGVFNDAASGGVHLRPPAVIVIAEVEDVGGARLDGHGLGGSDVVDLGR